MVVLLGSTVAGVVEIDGFSIPDSSGVFLVALAVHVLAGVTCVVSGAVAALARKRPGRHPRAGSVYLCGLLVLVITAGVLAVVRWPHDFYLLLIACLTGGFAGAGWWVRRRRADGWMRRHGMAMAASYVALLTGFYVDNGPQLPLWDRLPTVAYWVLPTLVGAPLTWWALIRNGAVSRQPGSGRNVVPQHPPG
jgi:uncharacterized membrane protein